jgi:hypothetical protein
MGKNKEITSAIEAKNWKGGLTQRNNECPDFAI